MTLHYRDDWLTVLHGDVRDELRTLPDESVHCVVTSPPYWGLRDYGDTDQLGLEPTPEQYVENMVAVFREVRRVLRSDGTLWLNLGDSYASSPPGNKDYAASMARTSGLAGAKSPKYQATLLAGHATKRNTVVGNLKPKDLVGIPWRVAFALQADGWYLRSDVIWSKPNPMPESVTDRPTKSHEYLFLLAKSARYYFDADAVREDQAPDSIAAYERARVTPREPGQWKQNEAVAHIGAGDTVSPNAAWSDPEKLDRLLSRGRNIRSVWTIATAPYPGAHFATFPPKLVEPCIKAGTSEKGVCPECGAPWERVVERPDPTLPAAKGPKGREYGTSDVDRRASFHVAGWRKAEPDVPRTTGWRPSCMCHTIMLPKPVPATVLDPFAGSGTTGMVAQSLSRRAVLIDLNIDYLGQLMERNREIPLGLESA